MNLNDIKEHYKNFDDWKIEKIATVLYKNRKFVNTNKLVIC